MPVDDVFWVRFGRHGQIEQLCWSVQGALSRSDRVVCRTSRGVEVGEVLVPATVHSEQGGTANTAILRIMRPEDDLLWTHLEKLGRETHAECERWLQSQDISAVVLDVEPLFDGKTLYFHFLSDVEETVQEHLDELVSLYEQQVKRSKFANLLEHGCGPGCGTRDACSASTESNSKGGCAVCKVAGGCAKPKAQHA